MKTTRRFDSGRGFVRWHSAPAIAAVLAMFASAGPSHADVGGVARDGTGAYAGVFAGSGRTDNRLIDVDGFADWGNPGATTDYDQSRTGRRRAGGTDVRGERHAAQGGDRRDVRRSLRAHGQARSHLHGRVGHFGVPMGRDGADRCRGTRRPRDGVRHRRARRGPDRQFRHRHRLLGDEVPRKGLAPGPRRFVPRQLDRDGMGDRRGSRSPAVRCVDAAAGRLVPGLRAEHVPRQPLGWEPVRARRPAPALPLRHREPAGHRAPGDHPPVRPATRRRRSRATPAVGELRGRIPARDPGPATD